MPGGVIGIAYVEVRPLMTGFGKAVETELQAGSGVATDLTAAGENAGASLGAGIGTGAENQLKKDGIKLSGLVDSSGKPLATSLENAGLLAGAGLGKGVGDGADKELQKTATKLNARLSNVFQNLGHNTDDLDEALLFGLPALPSKLNKVLEPAEVEAKGWAARVGRIIGSAFAVSGSVLTKGGMVGGAVLSETSGALKEQAGAVSALSNEYQKLGKVTLVAGGALAAGIGYESVKTAQEYQESVYKIAANSDITIGAAQNIGKAFLSTSGTAYASATEIAGAFAQVSGQLGSVEGKALTATQALKFMNTALDLNEAVAGDLNDTTSALGKTMQSFSFSLGQAGYASDVLFNASRLTNQSIDTVSSTVDRLHGRLGVLSPSLGGIATLMVALSKNGLPGSQAVQLVGTALTRLTGGSKAVNDQLALLGSGTSLVGLQATLAKVNAEIASGGAPNSGLAQLQSQLDGLKATVASYGSVTSSSPVYSTVKQLKASEAELTAEIKSQTDATKGSLVGLKDYKAQLELQIATGGKTGISLFNTKGQFIGMTAAIGKLHAAFETLTQKQQLQIATTLFGSRAAQAMVRIINEGPAAYERLQNSIEQKDAAEKAAAKNNASLKRQLEIIGSAIENEGVTIGLKLIPKLQQLAHWVDADIKWFQKHRTETKLLAEVIGTVLAGAVGSYVLGKGAALIGSLRNAASGATILSKSLGANGALAKSVEGTTVKVGLMDKALVGLSKLGTITIAVDLGGDLLNYLTGKIPGAKKNAAEAAKDPQVAALEKIPVVGNFVKSAANTGVYRYGQTTGRDVASAAAHVPGGTAAINFLTGGNPNGLINKVEDEHNQAIIAAARKRNAARSSLTALGGYTEIHIHESSHPRQTAAAVSSAIAKKVR